MDNKVAVITGASSGIGAAFARELAKLQYDLILVGRRKPLITSLARNLKKAHQINAKVIIAELADSWALDALIKNIAKIKNIDLLINNAGFGHLGAFHAASLANNVAMVNVHLLATIKLTHAVLPNMIKNKSGAIINVSSVMGFIPRPEHATYAATKSFLNSFSHALALELKSSNIRVQALCPGLTATDFFVKMGLTSENLDDHKPKFLPFMSPEKVVQKSLEYLAKNKVICVPGFINKLATFLAPLIGMPVVKLMFKKSRR